MVGQKNALKSKNFLKKLKKIKKIFCFCKISAAFRVWRHKKYFSKKIESNKENYNETITKYSDSELYTQYRKKKAISPLQSMKLK